MPTTIVIPESGEPFGPNFGFQVTTNFVGPIISPVWKLEIMSTDLEHVVRQGFVIPNPPSRNVSGTYLPVGAFVLPLRWVAEGHDAVLRATLTEGGGTEIEHADVTVKLDQITGNQAAILSAVNAVQGNVSGSSSLATQVSSILSGITHLFGSGISSVVGSLITKPPFGFVTRELIGDFDGNGSFTRPAPGIGVNAFGISWEILSYAGGIGLDTGVPVRFEVELLDLSIVYTDSDGHQFVGSAERFDFSNYYQFFEPSFPTRVDYVLAPSVTARFYWLLVG